MSPSQSITEAQSQSAIESSSQNGKRAARRVLADDQAAIDRIKELWASGERNQSAIAKIVDYPRATVAENIRKMKARGELEVSGA